MLASARSGMLHALFLNRWLHLTAGAAASVGLAYVAVRSLAWGEVIRTFQSFPVVYAALSLLPLAAAMLLRTARWHVLLHGEPATFGQVFVTQNTGIGLNNLLPIRMVSEPVQMALVTRRYKVPFPMALATLVAGNILDIFATGLLMLVGVWLVPGLRDGRIGIHLFGAFVMFVVSMLVFVAVSRGLGAIPIANRMRFFQRLMVAATLLRGRPLRLWASFGATLAHWLLLGVAGWGLALGLDMEVHPLTMATILVAATFFTSAVPSLPGGVGTYHFAIISMLSALDVDPAASFSFAIVMHLMVFAPSSAIALGMMSRVGMSFLLRSESHTADARSVPAGTVPGESEE